MTTTTKSGCERFEPLQGATHRPTIANYTQPDPTGSWGLAESFPECRYIVAIETNFIPYLLLYNHTVARPYSKGSIRLSISSVELGEGCSVFYMLNLPASIVRFAVACRTLGRSSVAAQGTSEARRLGQNVGSRWQPC